MRARTTRASEAAKAGSGTRGRRALLALTIGMLVAICCMFGYVMKGSYDDVDRGVAASAESLAAAVAQDVDRNIELLDFSLRGVTETWGMPAVQALDPALRDMLLFDSSLKAPGFGAILVLGADGTVRAKSLVGALSSTNFADRDYFRVHAFNRDVGLFVSKPFASRVSAEMIVALSRRIDNPDGSFGGVVIGTLKLSYLTKLYKGLNVGADGIVILFRTDGTVITREPYAGNDVRRWLGGTDVFNRLRASRSGSFRSASPLDGQHRIISFHRVGNLPLIQDVEISSADPYAAWWKKTLLITALLGAVCLGSLTLSIVLYAELGRRAAAERRLETLASTDELTGLPNRRRFTEVLHPAWAEARRDRAPLSLLMLDADNFKAYNDARGHPAGDKVLQAIARCLADSIQGSGHMACRCGGEEFVVLLPGTDELAAFALAESIRRRVMALGFAHPATAHRIATVSIGVATLFPTATQTPEHLVAIADAALYSAKAGGRNCSRTGSEPAPIAA